MVCVFKIINNINSLLLQYTRLHCREKENVYRTPCPVMKKVSQFFCPF